MQPQQQEIPAHFYDSDIASVNEKDFLSDNEPPKDKMKERKLLCKQNLLHIYKTIICLGYHMAKPAPFDKVHLKCKEVPTEHIVPRSNSKENSAEHQFPFYFNVDYLEGVEECSYNLGKAHKQTQRLVTSMRQGQIAVFELQHLQISKKTNIKVRKRIEVYVIAVRAWKIVIDLHCDGKFMKEIIKLGQGYSKVSLYDQVQFQYCIKQFGQLHYKGQYNKLMQMEPQFVQTLPKVIWQLLQSGKINEEMKMTVTNEVMKQLEGQKLDGKEINEDWQVWLKIKNFQSVDDIERNGKILKKTLLKGVSSACPDESSLVYYSLAVLNEINQTIYTDETFSSDWYQDPKKLQTLGCRKGYLDQRTMSTMLVIALKRMKPAEIAQIQCRDMKKFTFGNDFELVKQLFKKEQLPNRIKLHVRVFNFTEGKNCFNMNLQEKIIQSYRKQTIAANYQLQGKNRQALKIYQNIVQFFSSGQINQQSYDIKIRVSMKIMQCFMKQQSYSKMLEICQKVLDKPRHGYNVEEAKIAKHTEIAEQNQGKMVDLIQKEQIIQSCLEMRGQVLIKMGEGDKALKCLNQIQHKREKTMQLIVMANQLAKKYQNKSKQLFKNMFK